MPKPAQKPVKPKPKVEKKAKVKNVAKPEKKPAQPKSKKAVSEKWVATDFVIKKDGNPIFTIPENFKPYPVILTIKGDTFTLQQKKSGILVSGKYELLKDGWIGVDVEKISVPGLYLKGSSRNAVSELTFNGNVLGLNVKVVAKFEYANSQWKLVKLIAKTGQEEYSWDTNIPANLVGEKSAIIGQKDGYFLLFDYSLDNEWIKADLKGASLPQVYFKGRYEDDDTGIITADIFGYKVVATFKRR